MGDVGSNPSKLCSAATTSGFLHNQPPKPPLIPCLANLSISPLLLNAMNVSRGWRPPHGAQSHQYISQLLLSVPRLEGASKRSSVQVHWHSVHVLNHRHGFIRHHIRVIFFHWVWSAVRARVQIFC